MRDEETFISSDFTNKQSLESAFKELELFEGWPLVNSIAKTSIRIEFEQYSDDEISTGNSKVGGSPDLPDDFTYPRYNDSPLTFIAQINLDEVRQYDTDDLLPTSGLLTFFQCEDGWDANQLDKSLQLVFYFKEIADLKRQVSPERTVVLKPCKMRFFNQISIPSTWSIYRSDFFKAFNDDEDKLDLYNDALNYGMYINKLFGHPNNLQNPVEEEIGWKYDNNSQLIVESIESAKSDAPNWLLLFQMDEDSATDLYLGGGRLYYMIRKQDLVERNFGAVLLTGQC